MARKIAFLGFHSPSPTAINHNHKEEAQGILNQTTAGDYASLEQRHGIRYRQMIIWKTQYTAFHTFTVHKTNGELTTQCLSHFNLRLKQASQFS